MCYRLSAEWPTSRRSAWLDPRAYPAYPLAMPTPPLSFRTTLRGQIAELAISGEIDLLTAPSFVDAAGDLLSQGPRALVLDFHAVTFFDSAGVGALARIHRVASQSGSTLTIRGAKEMVRHVLEISGIAQVIPLTDAAAADQHD